MAIKNEYKFRKNDSIGTAGAEEDDSFLFDCFVNTGDLDILKDVTNPKRIVVGRTGSGKTALLRKLELDEKNVKVIEPEDMSLRFVSNSTIIRYLENLGVKLDLFYKLLWRHILVIELIQLRYHVNNQSQMKKFIERITDSVKGNKGKKDSLQYLNDYSDKFWETTEVRVKEVMDKLEEFLKVELGSSFDKIKMGIECGEEISQEVKSEIIYKSEKIVNEEQIAKLGKLITTLAEDGFHDKQKSYFIIIDRLDEDWVDDALRYKLIRALIDTVKEFKKFSNAKIVISLRTDLLEKVLSETRYAGFQEEKLRALFLELRWSKIELIAVIEKRLLKLIKHKYTNNCVSWNDIFPQMINKKMCSDYMIERTFRRPRDLITFVNRCIEIASDRTQLTAKIIKNAELKYSRERFHSVIFEWKDNYPMLEEAANALIGDKLSFKWTDIRSGVIDNLALKAYDEDGNPKGCEIGKLADLLLNSKVTNPEFKKGILWILYTVGFIGIKLNSDNSVSWSYDELSNINKVDINEKVGFFVTPMLYRHFSIQH